MLRDPTEKELESGVFNIIWDCIKKWDIGLPEDYKDGHQLYSGATGNHVVAIIDALKAADVLELNQPDNTISILTVLKDKHGEKRTFGRIVSFDRDEDYEGKNEIGSEGGLGKHVLDAWGRGLLDKDNDIKKAFDEMEFGW